MRKTCQIVLVLFLTAYIVALLQFAFTPLEYFGVAGEGLKYALLAPLGWPWIMLNDRISATFWPWFVAVAPAPNAAILWLLCARSGSRR